uniref:Uncharacterized protein n=1 Tax=Anguilla anguilla TaxID=7936 RepID=A0A0E9SU03_ANGAN
MVKTITVFVIAMSPLVENRLSGEKALTLDFVSQNIEHF